LGAGRKLRRTNWQQAMSFPNKLMKMQKALATSNFPRQQEGGGENPDKKCHAMALKQLCCLAIFYLCSRNYKEIRKYEKLLSCSGGISREMEKYGFPTNHGKQKFLATKSR